MDAQTLPEFSIAEDAIKWTRSGIQDVCAKAGKSCPRFIAHDHIGGWQTGRPPRSFAFMTVSEAGANLNSPDLVKIALITIDGKEHVHRCFPSETSDEYLDSWVEKILDGQGINYPLAKIRVYRGAEFIDHVFDVR